MTEKKSRSIFRVLLFPLMGLLTLEIAVMLLSLLLGDVFGQLRNNMDNILYRQVENRASYLLADMLESWSDLDVLAEEINLSVQERLDSGSDTLANICSESELYTSLLGEISQMLIDTMYSKQLSGTFVILTGPAEPQGETISLPGLYLRDRDPKTQSTTKNEDIMVQRAPFGVIQQGSLSTDTSWTAMFSREDSLEKLYFKPWYAARQDRAKLNTRDYGYWTDEAYTLSGSTSTAISYSIPLILEDGTVYGILGIELLTDYLCQILPAKELHSSGQGAYMLAVATEGEDTLKSVVVSGPADDTFRLSDNGTQAISQSGDTSAALYPLSLYKRNAPFDADKWYLMGTVPTEQLYEFVNRLNWLCFFAALLSLFLGGVGVLVVSYRVSRRIIRLGREVAQAREKNQIPELSGTDILEIDQLMEAVTDLSREVLDASTRFLSIMEMSSVDMGGFEVNEAAGTLYVTDNYFPLMGLSGVALDQLTAREFIQTRDQVVRTRDSSVEADGSILYTIPLEDGNVRYVRAKQKWIETRFIGLIEDVTADVLVRKQVERERDYDSLTGLLSRHGFRREAARIFRNAKALKVSALLMLDLDKLKMVNDKFGHNAGDAYITTAGNCFQDNAPSNALCARISGDEFLIFYYGYEEKMPIWRQVQTLFRQLHDLTFMLPDGTDHGVSASGGVAWCPDDTEDLTELIRYADFAMYCAKEKERGSVEEFDPDAYQEMLRQNQSQQEFYQVLEQKLLHYHFQPIFDAKTGEPFAYEALMRVNTPNIQSPLTILSFAKKTDRLREVEELTLFGATGAFEQLLKQGQVSPEGLLFINSIANTCMTEETEEQYTRRFADMRKKLVIEITEDAELDLEMVERKRRYLMRNGGALALDDYGSGYNTELNLLEIRPNYIKVDIAIVRNIHQDKNKQQLMQNIVHYAHERNMRVIAEGLEYPEEVEKSLELGVDLLQGYFLARPAAVPPPISEEARATIHAYWRSHTDP